MALIMPYRHSNPHNWKVIFSLSLKWHKSVRLLCWGFAMLDTDTITYLNVNWLFRCFDYMKTFHSDYNPKPITSHDSSWKHVFLQIHQQLKTFSYRMIERRARESGLVLAVNEHTEHDIGRYLILEMEWAFSNGFITKRIVYSPPVVFIQ